MRRASGIYQILNTANGKCYIGSAVSLEPRWLKHRRELRKGIHHSAKLQRAWDKYKESSFIFEPLITCTKSMLLFYEQQFIDQMPSEYNMLRVAGSRAGHKHSDATKAKMSIANMGNTRALGLKRPPEFGENVRRIHTGKIVSKETCARISAARKNPSQETLAKFRATRKGKPVATEAQAEKLRTQNIGRKHTPEAVANMRAAAQKRQRSQSCI